MTKKENGPNFTPRDQTGETLHLFAESSTNCKKCGAPPNEHEVRNFDPIFRDGDVHCMRCGSYVRMYDASQVL